MRAGFLQFDRISNPTARKMSKRDHHVPLIERMDKEYSIGGRRYYQLVSPWCETHPMAADAWESLRLSLVYFQAKTVGAM
ncbi:hypothetical protein U1Q18_034069 [Sarracenia purpurea var. burkii]